MVLTIRKVEILLAQVYKKLMKALKKEDRNEVITNKYLMRLREVQNHDEVLKKIQLDNVLKTAERILDENYSQMVYTEQHPIFSYIKVFTDAIQNQLAVEIIKNGRDNVEIQKGHYFNTVDALNHSINSILFKNLYSLSNRYKASDLKISNGKDPILTSIWESDRIVDNMSNIGKGMMEKASFENGVKKENTFKFDSMNHLSRYIYPWGITQVNNGNHSIFSGMNKGEGYICPNEVYDVSYLYNIYYFDGTYLINKHTEDRNEILFEIGSIFEIGRLLLLNYPQVFSKTVKDLVN